MQLFCDSKREEIKAANPGAGFGETGKLLAAAWKECSPEDRAHFQEQSQVRQGFQRCQTQTSDAKFLCLSDQGAKQYESYRTGCNLQKFDPPLTPCEH